MRNYRCLVKGCLSIKRKGDPYDKRFFKLPTDKSGRALWLQAINRKDTAATQRGYVCSDHFSDVMFTGPTKRRITSCALPDLNLRKKKKHIDSDISLSTKERILDLLAAGETETDVATYFNINEAIIRRIRKKETSIRKSIVSRTKLSTTTTPYTRDILTEKMEKVLKKWIQNNPEKRHPTERKSLRQAALKIYYRIKNMEPHCSSESNKYNEFMGTDAWMARFLKRHSSNRFQNEQNEYETESFNNTSVKDFSETFTNIIKAGEYSPEQVWDVSESNIFWKKMPSRTYVAKAQEMNISSKPLEHHAAVLLCSNASGNCVLKPYFVTRRPKLVEPQQLLYELPVHWIESDIPWVTTTIFMNWFFKCFIPEVRTYLDEKRLPFKVLLVMNNAPFIVQHPNVEFCYLPPKSAFLLQPMRQGIVATFRTYYIKRIFHYILNRLIENETLTALDAWRTFSIKDCAKLVGFAASELNSVTLNACWIYIWPECVKEANFITPYVTEYPNIITLAHAIGGEGFNDLSHEDIDELLGKEALDADDIIAVILDGFDFEQHSDNEDEREYEEIEDEEDEDDEEDDEEDEEEDEDEEEGEEERQEMEDEPEVQEKSLYLSADLIQEGLQLGTKLSNFFIRHDPNEERAEKFQRDLEILMAPYRELCNNLTETIQDPLQIKYDPDIIEI